MTLYELKNKKLPDSPGVYFFKNKQNILYIGKATSIKSRVRSYFNNDLIHTRGPSIVDMVTIANNISFLKTDSVLEALILEASLIKKHKPKYNVKEKDNKSFNHVIITDEMYPRVMVVRGHELKNGKINFPVKNEFGPFPNSGQLKESLRLIQKILPFFNTKKPVDKLTPLDIKRINLNIQLGLYPDVFTGKVTKKEYIKNIRNVTLFFEGKKKRIISNLKKQMNAESVNNEFEKANEIKKTIFALEHINDVSLLSTQEEYYDGEYRIEAYDIAHTSGADTVGVMTVLVNGQPVKSEYKKFIIRNAKKGDDYGALLEVLTRRFNHPEWGIPDMVVMDGGSGQRNVAVNFLKDNKVLDGIDVVSVVKDEHHKPKGVLGTKKTLIRKYSKDIIKVNSEAHRFAITFHRKRRDVIK